MGWYNLLKISNNIELQNLRNSLKSKYPGLELDVWERQSDGVVEIAHIIVPKDMRSGGIGTAVIKEIQEYAKSLGKPIVLSPSPEKRKKKSLDDFYKNLGFVTNKGRKMDYQLSTPFSRTMYWKPKK